ncbi:MAG: YidC/Oxa1 family membrane protein insertase [Clostridia bacterium]|nr:YidC/Oxa1 family membrane protein insertase [Clostridia bacterium]
MFDWLYRIFGTILSFFNDITGHYALALILYALVFKIVFLPFSIKTQKNQIAMAKLRPKMAKIEKKYAGRYDRATQQKKQQEIMELQQKEGYSPLSGCLPLLLQLPLIIFLYNVIRNPLEYICKWSDEAIKKVYDLIGYTNTADQIGAVGAIEDYIVANPADVAKIETLIGTSLELPNFELFGVNLASTPSFSAFNLLLLIPFLAAGFQWLSMFLSRKWMGNTQPTGGDAQSQMSMRIMDIAMPLMTVWFAFSFSGMLGLYWIYQSIFAIIQQYVLCKAMPLPKYTEAEIREMEKAEKERAKAQRAALQSQPKVKSLHYIDDEDYDELPEMKNKTEKKGTMGLSSSDLKDDKKN